MIKKLITCIRIIINILSIVQPGPPMHSAHYYTKKTIQATCINTCQDVFFTLISELSKSW